MKHEANISLIIRHYLKANPIPYSCPIEVKDTRGKDYLAFSEVKDEQINNALASKSSNGNLIRIASGTIGSPDYSWYINAPQAPIFIHYPKCLVSIDISVFVKERDTSKRKSLTSARAKEIAHTVIPLH